MAMTLRTVERKRSPGVMFRAAEFSPVALLSGERTRDSSRKLAGAEIGCSPILGRPVLCCCCGSAGGASATGDDMKWSISSSRSGVSERPSESLKLFSRGIVEAPCVGEGEDGNQDERASEGVYEGVGSRWKRTRSKNTS